MAEEVGGWQEVVERFLESRVSFLLSGSWALDHLKVLPCRLHHPCRWHKDREHGAACEPEEDGPHCRLLPARSLASAQGVG